MRIAYIVLTCEKYTRTRMRWQARTVFSSVNRADVFYLGHEMSAENHIYSWGAGDNYESLPYKFADFFRWSGLDYDWYFLMDDDTYVYTDRLQAQVKAITYSGVNPQQDAYMEGHILTHIAHTQWGAYHSGGAGTLLSARIYQEVSQMLRDIPGEYRSPHWCADICLGLWTRGIPAIRIEHSDKYHTDMAQAGDDTRSAITFHHLKTEEDYLAHRELS